MDSDLAIRAALEGCHLAGLCHLPLALPSDELDALALWSSGILMPFCSSSWWNSIRSLMIF